MRINDGSRGVDGSRKADAGAGDDDTGDGKHRDSRVLQLSLPEEGDPLRTVGAEFKGVKLKTKKLD